MCELVTQLCLTLCDPMNLPGSCVHRILQERIWSGLPFPSPGGLPDPGIRPASLTSPALAGKFFTTSTTWEAHTSAQYPTKNQQKETIYAVGKGVQISMHFYWLP